MLQSDPSLAATVLKVVNSAHYNFQQEISDIKHTTVLLGLNQVYQLAVAEGIRQIMPDTASFQEIQTHCIALSNIASAISQELQLEKPSQIATIGLLHDLGKSVVLLGRQGKLNGSFLIEIIDPDHMGMLLLKEWKLPDIVWQTIEFQSYPHFSPPDRVPEQINNNVTILYLAHLCYMSYRRWTEQNLPTTFLEAYAKKVCWGDLSLDSIARKRVLLMLTKNMDTYPASFTKLLNKFIQAIEP